MVMRGGGWEGSENWRKIEVMQGGGATKPWEGKAVEFISLWSLRRGFLGSVVQVTWEKNVTILDITQEDSSLPMSVSCQSSMTGETTEEQGWRNFEDK